MNIFLSEVENDNNIIETVFMSGNVFDNTVELFVPSTQEVMSGTFFFTDTLIFEQKLGGFASKSFDIRAMIPASCENEPVKTCLENETLN